jgi:hypothetical protein
MKSAKIGRLDYLETTLSSLIDRLDSGSGPQRQSTPEPSPRRQSSQPEDAPPVLMIRDVASAMGVQSPEDALARPPNTEADIFTKAGISEAAADEMLAL